MAKHIFISYRRDDSQKECGRIRGELARRYGEDVVFKDTESVPAGVDFRKYTRGKLRKSVVELVVIGKAWADIRDEQGVRRLDDPNDLVRQEVREALKLKRLVVIPIMVDNAQMPSPEDLPADIRQLTNINLERVRDDPDFRNDMERLFGRLDKLVPPALSSKDISNNSISTSYPRAKPGQIIRTLLLWSPLAIWAPIGLVGLVLSRAVSSPGLIPWIISSSVLLSILALSCSAWAFYDLRKEQHEIARRQVGVNVPPKPIGDIVGESSEVSGPPFDEDLLPEPPQFVGRTEDLKWVLDQLEGGGVSGITALNGMGGIGKTTLAAKAIRGLRETFSDGIAVVICEDNYDWSNILQTVVSRFDPQRQLPKQTDGDSLIELTQRRLQGKNVLIVLDNVEPGLDIVKVVTPLRQAGATVLITARETLPIAAVPPQANLTVNLLSDEDALELFAQSYGRNSASELRSGERSAAKEIVKVLDCHTQAVKLAGAHAKVCRPNLSSFARDLQIDPLGISDAKIPRPLAKVFEHSFNALSPETQRLFSGLAAFATGEFGRMAATELGHGLRAFDPKACINELILHSLMDTYSADLISSNSDCERLHLHPLVRQLSISQLANWASEQRNDARLAVATYFARYTNETNDNNALSLDEINISEALVWAHDNRYDGLVAGICTGMQNLWRDRAHTSDSFRYLPWGQEAAEAIAARTQSQSDVIRAADLALSYGVAVKFKGELEKAEDIFNKNLLIRRTIGDRTREAKILTELGWISQRLGGLENLEKAERYYIQSLEILRQLGNEPKAEGWALYWIGEVERFRDNWEAAKRIHLESLEVRQAVGDLLGEGRSLCSLARTFLGVHDLDKAEAHAKQALTIARAEQDRWGEGFAISAMAQIMRSRGYLIEAEALYRQSLAINEEVQSQWDVAITHYALGLVASARGDLAEAEVCYQKALTGYINLRSLSSQADQKQNLASVASERGQLDKAELYLHQALSLSRDAHERVDEFDILLDIARLAADQGQLGAAEGYYQKAYIIEQGLRTMDGAIARLRMLGQFEQERHHENAAAILYQEALTIARRKHDRRSQRGILITLGLSVLESRQLDAARNYLQQAFAITLELGQRASTMNDLAHQARLELQSGHIDDAEALFRKSVAIAQELRDIRSESSIIKMLGDLEKERGNFDAAETYFRQQLEINVNIGNWRGEASCLVDLGDLESERDHSQQAEFYLQQALNLYRKMHIRRGETSCLVRLGRVKRSAGDYDSALMYFNDALTINREMKAPDAMAVDLVELGRLALETARFDQSDDYLNEALAIERNLEDLTSQRIILSELARSTLGRRPIDMDKAISYFYQILVIDRELKEPGAESSHLMELGHLELARGNQVAANACFEQALILAKELDDNQKQSADLTNLGRLAKARQRYEEAESYFQQALSIDMGLNHHQNIRVDLLDLGRLAITRQHFDQAKAYLEQAREISQQLSDYRSLVSDLIELVRLELVRKHDEDADKYAQQLLSTLRRTNDRGKERNVLDDLAELAIDKRRYDEADRYYQQAMLIDRELAEPQNESQHLTLLGRLAINRNRYSEAEEFFHQALIIDRRLQNRDDERADLHDLGYLAEKLRKFDIAESYLTQTLAIDHESADHNRESDDLVELAKLERQRGHLQKSESFLRQALTLDRESKNRLAEGVDQTELGHLAREFGRFDEADTLLQESITIDQDRGNIADMAFALLERGVLARTRGRVEDGERFVENALDTYPRSVLSAKDTELDDSSQPSEGLALSSELPGFINLMVEFGLEVHPEVTKVETTLTRTLLTARTEKDRAAERILLIALGQIAGLNERFEQANNYLCEALAIDQMVGDHWGERETLCELGRLARQRKHTKEAETYLMQSLAAARMVGDRWGERETLCELGRLARQRKHTKEAEKLIQQALLIDRELQDLRSESKDLWELAGVLASTRRVNETKACYRSLLDTVSRMGTLPLYATVATEFSHYLGKHRGNVVEANQLAQEAYEARKRMGIIDINALSPTTVL